MTGHQVRSGRAICTPMFGPSVVQHRGTGSYTLSPDNSMLDNAVTDCGLDATGWRRLTAATARHLRRCRRCWPDAT